MKIVVQTHYITFQDIDLQPYFKLACVKSVLWPVLISNVVNVSLSDGSLGYWIACNDFKRYCTFPYSDKRVISIFLTRTAGNIARNKIYIKPGRYHFSRAPVTIVKSFVTSSITLQNQLWRHHQNVNRPSDARSRCMKSWFMGSSCRVRKGMMSVLYCRE